MTDFPDVKLKALVQFPANAYGGTGIEIVKANQNYTVNLEYGDFMPVSEDLPGGLVGLVWDPTGDTYYLAPLTFTGGVGIPEAPTDGNKYARQSSAWTVITSFPEAPSDGTAYGRKNTAWSAVLQDAPIDGNFYGRKDGAWVVPTGSNVPWSSYTPTLAFATPGSPVPTLSNGVFRYTVVSNVVHLTFDITLSAVGTGANGMLLMSLPVTCGSTIVSGGGKETVAGKGLTITETTLNTQLGIGLADGTSCITAGAGSRFVGVAVYEKQLLAGTPPSFVNATAQSSVTATTITPALPTSRVNGNLLIGWARIFGTQTGTLSVSSGWTICVPINQGGTRPAIVFYRYVDGTETAPVITSSAGSSQLYAQVTQYTGAIGAIPFGNFITTWADGTTASDTGTLTDPRSAAVTLAYPFSTVINFSLYPSGSPAAPSGFTSRSLTAGALVSDRVTINVGDKAGPYNTAGGTAANWTTCLLEVRSQ